MDLPVKLEPAGDDENVPQDTTFVGTLLPSKSEASDKPSITSTKIFSCHLCTYSTSDRGNFNRHLKGKHKLPEAFDKPSSTPTKIFNCHLCDYSSNDRGNFKRHQKCKHRLTEAFSKNSEAIVKAETTLTNTVEDDSTALTGTKDIKSEMSSLSLNIPCKFCEFNTESKFIMINHVHMTHSEVSLDVSNVKSCKFCNFTSKCRKTMRYHRKTEHTELLTVYTCNECTYQSNSEESLKLHRKFHGEMKDYPGVKCGYCDFIYKHHPSDQLGSRRCKKQLNEHMNEEHAEVKLKCDQCEKTVWTPRQLKVHMVRHDNTAENGCLSCDKCGYKCKSAHTLKHHIDAVHLGEKKHLCDWCPKAFATTSTLNKHILSHTDERNFKCQFCKKAFHTKGNLGTHIRTHTGEKPFTCDICGKSFSDQSYLGKHTRLHDTSLSGKPAKEFSCEVCSKGFTRRSYLESHLATHLHQVDGRPAKYSNEFKMEAVVKAKILGLYQAATEMCVNRNTLKNWVKLSVHPHICSTCGKAFSYEAQLKRHVRTHHYEEGKDEINIRYDAAFKQEVAQYALENTIQEAIKRFQLPHSTINSWLKRISNPWICQLCGKPFSNESTVRRHIEQVHKNTPEGAAELVKRSEELQCSQPFSEFLAQNDLLPSEKQVMEICREKEKKKQQKEEFAKQAQEIMLRRVKGEVVVKNEDGNEELNVFSPITCLIVPGDDIDNFQESELREPV